MKALPVLKVINQRGTSNNSWSSDCDQEVAALKRLGEEIVYLIEKSATLQALKHTNPPIRRPSRVSVLYRRDRTVAFLAGYSSKASDCPFLIEDSVSTCLTLVNNDASDLPGWECLGLSFHLGVPCPRLWKIIALEKNHDHCKLFDLPI
jgi:hypothetical protein